MPPPERRSPSDVGILTSSRSFSILIGSFWSSDICVRLSMHYRAGRTVTAERVALSLPRGSHAHTASRHRRFGLRDAELAEVEDRCSKHRIGPTNEHPISEVIK